MKSKVTMKKTILLLLMSLCLQANDLLAQGSWTTSVRTGVEAIHMGLLPPAGSNPARVIVYSYRDPFASPSEGPYPAGIFNPNSPLSGIIRTTTDSHFCGGHTMMADGRFFMIDGETANSEGSPAGGGDINMYNPATDTWENGGKMASSSIRWYPSTILLGNGKLVTFGGTTHGGGDLASFVNGDRSLEVFDPATNTSTCISGCSNLMPYQDANAYPRVFLLDDNSTTNVFKILMTGADADSYIFTINTDTNTGSVITGPQDGQAPGSGNGKGRAQGTYARLDDGSILALGGTAPNSEEGGANTVSRMLNPESSSRSWSNATNMSFGRMNTLCQLMADGQLLAFGGDVSGTSQYTPEMFNPVSNTWTSMAMMNGSGTDTEGRNYHTSAVLLPDGRLCVSGGEGIDNPRTAGGTLGVGGETDLTTFYSPPYLSTATARPVITSAPSTANYNQSIAINYDATKGPVTMVKLRRTGTSTHSFAYDMRGHTLFTGSDSDGTVNVTIPNNSNQVIPGYYLLFIFRDSGNVKVPSVATWIKIDGSSTPGDTNPPSQPTIQSVVADSSTQITVTSTISTDAEGSNPVEYQFEETSNNTGGTDSDWQPSTIYVDASLNTNTQYCYKVRARDAAGTPNETGYSSVNGVCTFTLSVDTTSPAAPVWATNGQPTAVGDTMITMQVDAVSDPSTPVMYSFEETSGNNGPNSGWQVSPSFVASGLNAATTYTYQVRARDGAAIPNVGSYSSALSAMTAIEDNNIEITVGLNGTNSFTPANVTLNVGQTVDWNFVSNGHNVWSGLSGAHTVLLGDPAWTGLPGGGTMLFNSSSAPPTTNPAGFEYSVTFDQNFLDNSTGDAGATNQYNYHCHVHGSGSPNLMFGTITINGGNDVKAPIPNPMTFAMPPNATSSSAITMTATTALDGQSPPVQYNFVNTSSTGTGGSSSGWQNSATFTDVGLEAGKNYCYTVQARDFAGAGSTMNSGVASSAVCADTQNAPTCGSGQPFSDYLGAGHTTGITVTQSSVDETATGVKTIDGSGLSGNNHGGTWNHSWQSPSASANPNSTRGTTHWIRYDFGHLYTLGVMQAWNHSESGVTTRGLQSVSIDYSQDGTNWTQLGSGPFTFPQASDSGANNGFNAADFGGVCARYVILTSNTNYSNGFAHALAEVKFNIVSSGPTQCTVPNVVGQAQATAQTNITNANLTVGTVTNQSSSTVAAGNVISTSPAASSSVTCGSAVNIVVSTGPALCTVPNVVGQAQATAQTNITNANLTVGTVTNQSSSTVAVGNVISTSPAASTSVTCGSAVNIFVSTGPALCTVPNVVGQAQATAQTNITNANLTVGTVTNQSSSTVAAGNVISTSPAASTSVTCGSAVNIFVSTGPALCTVPNVVGQAQATAQTNITNANLTVGTVTNQSSSTVAAGNVISTSPAASSSVTCGSAVNIFVSTGPGGGTGPITITNHSFEQPGTGSEVTNFGNIPGWNGPTSGESGISNGDGGTNGSWSMFLCNCDSFATQTTSHTIAAGTYQVQVDAKEEGTLQVELFHGSTILGSQSFAISSDSFSTKSFNVIVSGSNPGIGQTLGIRLQNSASGESWTVVDNVRVTKTN